MTRNNKPNIPKSQQGHRRESAEKHNQAAREKSAQPGMFTDSEQRARMGLPQRLVLDFGVENRTDLAGIERRADGE